MSPVVTQLGAGDTSDADSLWQVANDSRRRELGQQPIQESGDVLSRPGVFAVGVVENRNLLSMAIAMPALADDGRSVHNVPGLAHISSVATLPSHWGRGLAGVSLRAIMAQAGRRGFARAQLFTHDNNAAARQLYERAGFELSGRQKVDQHGDPLVHYLRDLPALPRIFRPAARLVCLDPTDRILLMHWRDPLDGYQLWEPPGGGIEPGETSYDAVLREWREETGLPEPRMLGEVTAVAREVIFNGIRSVVVENFHLGRLSVAGEPRPDEATALEQEAYLGHSWVPWRELESLDDEVEPDLLPVLQRLAPTGPWSEAT